MAANGGGRRKDTENIPGYRIPDDRRLIPPTSGTRVIEAQEPNEGQCKHGLTLNCCSVCEELRKSLTPKLQRRGWYE